MTIQTPPFERFFNLAKLSEAGEDVRISAKPDQLEHIAEWGGVLAVERFEAIISLRRLSSNRYIYEAALNADVIQQSVVSLEPVRANVERIFARGLHVMHRTKARVAEEQGSTVTITLSDDEEPEELDSPDYDLVAPLLEELLLALPPYPRAPGEAFAPPGDDDPIREGPFADLKALKGDG